jgi:hypothetical protein
MGRVLTYEVPEELYAVLERAAQEEGIPVADWLSRYLETHLLSNHEVPTEEQRRSAVQRFEECLGSISLGYPTGTDNQGIDRDLAREYAGSHSEDA